MFESLTEYIPQLNNSQHGEWIFDTENDGTMEHPFHMPYVDYDEIVMKFVEDIYAFVDEHPEFELTSYSKILEENGIEWGSKSMAAADVSNLDGKSVMALLVGIVRADRFCEGTLLKFLKSDKIIEWLRRLKEIDNK